jgi:putative ABC transport system substrate-binding protein
VLLGCALKTRSWYSCRLPMLKQVAAKKPLQVASLLILGLAFLLDCVFAAEHRNSMHRIGLLSPRASDPARPGIGGRLHFIQGLRELGYIEGQNIIIESRYADGSPEKFPELAAELIRRNIAVLVAVGPTATAAAMKATRWIPIVMAGSGNPLSRGFVKSLSAPGGNVTGLSSFSEGEDAKRLELLKETFPPALRIVVMNSDRTIRSDNYKVAGERLGLDVRVVLVNPTGEFAKVMLTVVNLRPRLSLLCEIVSVMPIRKDSWSLR